MFKTNARTKTASALTASGDRLRLETPQFMAQCLTDRVPYVMPDPSGGYVVLAEYGDPCPEPVVIDKPTGCGCGGGCADASKCNKPKNCEQKKLCSEQPNRAGLEKDDEDRLLRYEIAKYSGYDADGVTLILSQRGVEGTIKQDWPVNTLVMQVMTGAELKDVYSSINGIKSFLDSLGYILAVPRNPDGTCGGWNEGDWAFFGGKFYRSKENGNCTVAPGDKWEGGFDLFDLLDMYLKWINDCDGKRIPFGTRIVTCAALDKVVCSISVTDTRKLPSGSPVKVTRQNGLCDPQFVVDYDASITPTTASAPVGPWRAVVEASDGKEYRLRSGIGYRELYDGKVEMWGRVIVGVGSEDVAVAAKLPVLLNGPITYGNTHISITDAGWAANPGQHLDDLPGDYPNDPSTDKLNQTDMGWGPSNANPTGEFVIWAYQHEQSGSAAIELVSWHLVTERGIA